MAYQALYRKWRPRTFGSVVGQEDITATLKNAIKRDTVSHAFLFAGPRGTGKTSCAQIFAKALNCTNLQDGNPCNECANCLAADRDTMPDIIEIDAASNNGVDEIRDIRDKVKYAPTQGKYKVYIIDEVHMLSMGAFNALLKTLEEPPQHVIFILATTELQKVPATIISRTQRYNFKQISQKQLVLRMKYILDKEKITYEEKALTVIAQVADGGMRDALSILDQLLSYEKGSVDYATALKITGFADQKKIEQIFLAILNKDTTEALTSAQEVLASGANVKNVLDELIELTTRALILVKTQESEGNFLTPDFAKKVKQVPLTHYFRLITLANQALNDLRYTNQQEIPLTVFLVEMADDEVTQVNKTSQDQTLQKEVTDLKKQVTSLTRQMNNLSSASIDKKNNQVIQQVEQNDSSKNQTLSKKIAKPKKMPKNTKAQSEKNRQQVYQVLVNATKENLQTIKDIWIDLHSVLAVSERALLDVLEPVAASSEQVVMKCEYTLWFEKASSDSDLLERLASEIEKFTKHNYEIVLVPADDWLNIRAQFLKEHKKDLLSNKKKKKDKVNDDSREVVDKAKELFGDTVKIKD